MKRYILLPLLFVSLFLSAITSGAQTATVRMPAGEMTVGESLEAVATQSGHRLSYSSKALDVGRRVRFSQPVMQFDKALAHILEGSGCTYSVQGKYIILRKREDVKATTDPLPESTLPAQRNAVAERPIPVPVQNNVDSTRDSLPQEPGPVATHDTSRVNIDRIEPEIIIAPIYSSYVVPVESYVTGNRLPRFMLKTNLLHGAAAFAPNAGIEVGLGRRTTLELHIGINAWRLQSRIGDNKKLAHQFIRPEMRFWLNERFKGHFVGAHAFFAQYNIGSHDIPMLFKKEYRYDGNAIGGGFTYGYHLAISRRWGAEFNVGVGAMWLNYDRFSCAGCERSARRMHKTYYGPTRAGVTLVFNLR